MILFITFSIIYLSILIKQIDIPVILPVEEIQVFGEFKFINADDIKAKVRANTVGGYFTVDMNLIREVLVREPWIKTVTLRRQWPASLNVSIEERTPIAYWNNDAYISESGEAFAPASIDQSLNLPLLKGPQGRHDNVWQFMNELYQEMARLNYEIVSLTLDQRRAWQLVITSVETATDINQDLDHEDLRNEYLGNEGLDNEDLDQQEPKHTINVRLGRFDTEKRLQRFVRVLPALINEYRYQNQSQHRNATTIAEKPATEQMQDQASSNVQNKIKTIDMRYPNGFAVQMMSAVVFPATSHLSSQSNRIKA